MRSSPEGDRKALWSRPLARNPKPPLKGEVPQTEGCAIQRKKQSCRPPEGVEGAIGKPPPRPHRDETLRKLKDQQGSFRVCGCGIYKRCAEYASLFSARWAKLTALLG